jgi:hypothetical protein
MTTTLAFDWSEGPSAAVVAAVASELGAEPEGLDAPLNDYVDPDALDALFAPTYEGIPRAEGDVVFSMHGCEVTVSTSGRVSADRLAEHASAQGQPDESRTPG